MRLTVYNGGKYSFAATKPSEEDFAALMNDLLIAFKMGDDAPRHVCERICDYIEDHTATYCGAQAIDTIMMPKEDQAEFEKMCKEHIARQAAECALKDGAFEFRNNYAPIDDDWDGPYPPRKYIFGAVTVFLPNGKKGE